jgi:eukaryotic-like serine/threonine-protein kinase
VSANIQASNAAKHLSTPDLQLLLSEDHASDEYRAAAMHLERCETCQLQLTTYAADSNWWAEVHEFLSGDDQPRWQPDLSQSSVFASDASESRQVESDHVLKLLGSPNHPEMLGRLGRYDIEKIVGSGGMGIVLKAHDSELNRPIAIKLLAPHVSHVGAARERFAREGRAAAAVVHEHVVAIYNVEVEGTLPFLTMQYVPGRSLQARVDEDGPLKVEEILRIGMQAAAGLAAAHAQGLVHRDVKPSNILLEDTVERAVLTDFGLARAMNDASLTQTGIIAGTPHYMSPEQATGEEIDHRSDLFSLGAVLYFMATGHPPFRAANAFAVLHRICQEKHRPIWQWNNNVPDELCDIVDQLLEKKPARRLASAEEVRQQLASLLSRVQQHGVRRSSTGGSRLKRRRQVFLAGSAVAATAVVGAVAAWLATAWTLLKYPTALTITQVEELKSDGAEYAVNLQYVQESLNQTGRESVYLQQGDDAWRREIESLQNDLNNIESNHHLVPQ